MWEVIISKSSSTKATWVTGMSRHPGAEEDEESACDGVTKEEEVEEEEERVAGGSQIGQSIGVLMSRAVSGLFSRRFDASDNGLA